MLVNHYVSLLSSQNLSITSMHYIQHINPKPKPDPSKPIQSHMLIKYMLFLVAHYNICEWGLFFFFFSYWSKSVYLFIFHTLHFALDIFFFFWIFFSFVNKKNEYINGQAYCIFYPLESNINNIFFYCEILSENITLELYVGTTTRICMYI